MSDVHSIPLRRRDGTIRAHAIVDLEDLHWLVPWRWHFMGDGYARRTISYGGRKLSIPMHREILGLRPGDTREGDHINGDKLDNRRANLRAVTHAENGQNLAPRAGTRSTHRGVNWVAETGKWRAIATVAGVRHDLGRFASEAEAGAVAAAFRRDAMPFAVEGR